MTSRLGSRGARRAGAALALALAVAGLAGCGSAPDFSSADVANGKTMFAGCGSCHTLADAGTTGAVGPNLDDSFRAARQAGMHSDQFAGVVHRWIKIAQPPMPRNIVTGQDAIDVAAYVASVAGRSADSTVRKAPPETPQAPADDRQQLD